MILSLEKGQGRVLMPDDQPIRFLRFIKERRAKRKSVAAEDLSRQFGQSRTFRE